MDYSERRGTLPAELIRFLEVPGGHSLVIKGEAGTGKTTLALQLIEMMSNRENQYYLSSRVSDESLFRQFPWLKETTEKVKLLKAGKAFLLHMTGSSKRTDTESSEASRQEEFTDLGPAVELLKALNQSDEKLTVDRTELHRLEGQIEEGTISATEEIAPSRISFEGNSVDLVLGRLLPELEVAYDRVEERLPERSLVVIDSIDGLGEKYDIPPERLLTVIQKDIVEGSGANVVYVLESAGGTHMDYLGDGVVSLSTKEFAGRRGRIMQLEKLRGVKIDRHKYMFTLVNGRLETFPASPNQIQQSERKWRSVSSPGNETASFGSSQLDRIFGGLPFGSVTLIEVGANVPSVYSDVLQDAMVANFASRNNGVAWIPSRKASYDLLHDRISEMIGEEKFERNVRIFEQSSAAPTDVPYLISLEGNKLLTDLKWETIEYNLSESNHPFLSLLGFDILESMYGSEDDSGLLDGLVEHVGAIRRGKHVMVAQALSSSKLYLQWLSDISLMHIKLENIEGTVMLYGMKPYTQFYGMMPDPSADDNIPISLVPVS
ncbi:MAG: hypothetical protein KIY12_06245 [Thermoplasmata archaeon]|uniref:GvpD P-loop domain-containing protein n=1 Tax=Candidatus Sysuiplasma superficiale TaxID=2823368 RepID=A0A8J8CD99_9ARCH|nr:hypothetical protein [Candidatus Sysuiplasma superficiale]MBX8644304.1 hypothetical protein [Candidatus Sysuiplasma superficiale]MCL4346463.1 hypothetical protein [Candidatus Thermoplasmatota archaeon]MCL5437134.1 hypothetical protein [Candidatus Thermoplasmatota archaeon]